MSKAEQISRRLKLRHLNILLAVVERGSMAKAAEQLSISQPVISTAIADLEHVVGVRLLDRGPHGVEPTLYGRALLKRSVALFNDLRATVSELEILADPTAGELRIGSTEPMTAGLLSAVIDRLSRRHPKLKFHVTLAELGILLDRDLRTHNIDLMMGRLPSETEDTMSHMLFREGAYVVAGARNALVRRRKVDLEELSSEPWCLPPPDSFAGSLITKAFRARGLDFPATSVTAFSVQLQNSLLATGRYLTILPGAMLRFSAERLSLKVIPVDLEVERWPVGIVVLRNRTPNPAVQLFVDCARKIAGRLGDV
jgi:DNA-binding transcriptional LysR family regulator